MRKIKIYEPLKFFSPTIELVRELLITNLHDKFEQDTWKTFEVITKSNYWRKKQKIAINRPFCFFHPLLNLSENQLVIGNMHNKFGKDTWNKFCYRAHK